MTNRKSRYKLAGAWANKLNNRIVFIATNANSKSEHNPEKGAGVCGLSPVCTRKWEKGEPIAVVFIFESIDHPQNESEQWVCQHHHATSVKGENFQLQKMCRPTKPKKSSDPFKDLDDLKAAMGDASKKGNKDDGKKKDKEESKKKPKK